MSQINATTRRYAVHGLAVELSCAIPALDDAVARALEPFATRDLPEGYSPSRGVILPFDEAQVIRTISPSAVRLPSGEDMLELYQDGERFWIVDERVGLVEINLLRGSWRSWLLPHPTTDDVRIIDVALLFPLAQVLRAKGLWLVPAASISRAGWGVLIIAPFSIELELRTLISAGYRVVGQRWSALRQENGRLEMLHLPGEVERCYCPHLRDAGGPLPQWIDLGADYPGCTQPQSFCDAVLLAEPGRRNKAHISELPAPRAVEVLRAHWPIVDLHPSRRAAALPLKLAQRARCCELQLSRNHTDLLVLLDSLRYAPAATVSAFHRVTSSELTPAPSAAA